MMHKNHLETLNKDTKFNIFGWVVFIICSLFFLASSIKNKDIFSLIGSILFLFACFVFLVPLLKPSKPDGDE